MSKHDLITEAERIVAVAAANAYAVEKARHESSVVVGAKTKIPKLVTSFDELRLDAGRHSALSGAEAVEQRPKPGFDRRQTVWAGVARVILGAGVSPEYFMRRQFAALPRGAKTPFPEMFLAADVLDALKDNPAEALLAAEVSLRDSMRRLHMETKTLRDSGYDREQAWAYALSDPDMLFTPLFRYCTAADLARNPDTPRRDLFVRLAATYKAQAITQFGAAPDAYRQVWGPILPPGFPAETTTREFKE